MNAAPAGECIVCGIRDVERFCSAVDRVLVRREQSWDILRCIQCGFGWTSPPLAEEDIATYYPASYLGDTARTIEEYLTGRLVGSRLWRGETAKARLVERFCAGGSLLDVGCGDGKFLWALDGGRWQRTGVEPAGEILDLVRSKIPGLRLVCGDIYSAELAPASFDVVTFWHVLEHLPRPARVLSRAAALLRPGGWLFVSLPNLGSLQARLFRQSWYPFDDVPRHLYHFSQDSLERLLRRAELNVRVHLPFSPSVNFHSLKHSLLHWSEDRTRSRVPYYLLKPFLFGIPILERLLRSYGILTTVAQKREQGTLSP
jgi:SAM-dependent methyltransferase